MKPLASLFDNIPYKHLYGAEHINIQDICLDSRKATPDSLFVAILGTEHDGSAYINDAIAAGSTAIVSESLPEARNPNITYIQVTDAAHTLGLLASQFYDHPSQHLQVVAVTGTSGKTSTVHILYNVFRYLGYNVGMLSTIHNQVNDTILPSTLTTPDALYIQQLLHQMVAANCQYCFMEASSHALCQDRLAGLHLAGAIFLNISHDHLDYHHTLDAYIKAKKKLFDNLPKSAFTLYNIDDKCGKVMIQNTKSTPYSYAIQAPADFKAKIISNTWQGIELQIDHHKVWCQLLGNINAYNLLAAYATAALLHQPQLDTLVALSTIGPIQGRMQQLHTDKKINILIDYAHKPEALKKVLLTLNQLRTQMHTKGSIITIIGCGGNRDTDKRPLMAQIACKHSDQVILTSDNPRYEDPQAIIEEMKCGLSVAQQARVWSIIDRKEAIKIAYQTAKQGDIVLIAGKGHEGYQEIKGAKYPLKDEDIVNQLMR